MDNNIFWQFQYSIQGEEFWGKWWSHKFLLREVKIAQYCIYIDRAFYNLQY